MELMPQLDRQGNEAIYMQLYRYIKEEITAKRLNQDEMLPSVRFLSKHLGISKNTVETAYEQLMAEGYIYSKPQRGYFIANLDTLEIYEKTPVRKTFAIVEKSYDYDFRNEYVEVDNFDFNLWKKHMNTVINSDQDVLFTHGNPQGERELRKNIVKYIYRTRGVNAHEDQVIVGAGVQPLLNILAFLFQKLGLRSIAVEDPGFNRAKSIFKRNHFTLMPLPTNEASVDTELLAQTGTRLCYVSPSHQFPTGAVMRIDARNRLIKWAYEQDGYIIEDDYNSELRYVGKPIPALQGLEHQGRVIYLGTFSAVLVPSIRLSFMVLPDALMTLYLQDQNEFALTASKLEQLTLSRMMETGDFDRHIRKIRKAYADKSSYLIKIIEQHMENKASIIGINPGLNILLELNVETDEEKLIETLRSKGINAGSLSEYRLKPHKVGLPVIVLNFRGIESTKIADGIICLSETIKNM